MSALDHADGERTRVGRSVVTGEVLSVQQPLHGESAWVAGTLRMPDTKTIRFVGHDLPPCLVGSIVRVAGVLEVHPEYGDQLRVTELQATVPREADAAERYLAANVRGCGKARAARIVKVLGADCIERLRNDPALIEPLFSGTVRTQLRYAVEQWATEARRDTKAQELTLRLLKARVRYGDVRKIMGYFDSAEAAEVVTLRRPYRLIEVPGLGWTLTDRIARLLGVSERDPARLEAACLHALEVAMERGHSGLPRGDVIAAAARLTTLPIGDAAITGALDALEGNGAVVVVDGLVMRPDVVDAEWEVAERIGRLVRTVPLSIAERDLLQPLIDEAQLSTAQAGAVWMALTSGVAVLSGRPGSGKTTTLKTFVRCCQALKRKVQVVAPTGKAASRAAAVTGAPASTIHRLLGGQPDAAQGARIDADVVIVDEASMCDLELALWLVRSLDLERTQLLWTGDGNQLPSVQYGRVLQDMIDSAVVPTTNLVQVFRQAAGSRIVQNAHRLLDEEPLDQSPAMDWRTAFVGEQAGPVAATQQLLHEVRTRLAEGVEAADIQVLSPSRKGPLGVDALNERLQQLLNPLGAPGPRIGGGARVRVGDRVVMTRNCYDLPQPMYNGEQGVVIAHDAQEQSVAVQVDERTVVLRGVQCLLLRLAWAMTVHRSQGSEYPYTVLVYHHTAHAALIGRPVLYTAITRAKRCFSLVGTARAVEATVQGVGAGERYSRLAHHLRTARSTRHASHEPASHPAAPPASLDDRGAGPRQRPRGDSAENRELGGVDAA